MSNFDPRYRKKRRSGSRISAEVTEEEARRAAFWFFDRWRYIRWTQGYQKVRITQ